MTIRDLVRAYLLADATVASFMGDRVYPAILPQKVTYPAGKLFRVDVVRPQTLRTVAGLATARLQFDVFCDGNGAAALSYAGSQAVVDAVGAAVRNRLDGFGWKDGADLYLTDTSTSPNPLVRAWIRIDDESGGDEPEIHGGLSRHTADFLVQFQTNYGEY